MAPAIDAVLADALRILAESQIPMTARLRNAGPAGGLAARAAGAHLLSSRWRVPPTASRVLIMNGTQNALAFLIRRLVGPEGVLLAETLTYAALRPVASFLGVRVVGVPIDGEGLDPDALDAACQKHYPCALYCNPTLHNPTTAVMPLTRRQQVAEIAASHNCAILEDDVLGPLFPDAPPPIAALAPDRTWYLCGLTKCVAHGLRIAIAVAPSDFEVERLIADMSPLSVTAPTALSEELLVELAKNGRFARIVDDVRTELDARFLLAQEVLGPLSAPKGAPHIWLPLDARADTVVRACADCGVLVRSAAPFAVDDTWPDALRVSLSSEADLPRLDHGLRVLRERVAWVAS